MTYNRIAHISLHRRAATHRRRAGRRGLVVRHARSRDARHRACVAGGLPSRDLIVLSGFTVVLGTLVVQGLTLGPLLKLPNFEPDKSFARDHAAARIDMLNAACRQFADRDDEAATQLRLEFDAERALTEEGLHWHDPSSFGQLRIEAIAAMRQILSGLRTSGAIGEDVFYTLQQEVDWAAIRN